jgi:type IV pilus assembly protein PilQ
MSISNNVQGRVNLFVNNVPIRDIFDIVLRSNGLAYEKRGELYHVMTEAEYKDLHGERFSDTRVVKTFRLQYAMPEMAFNLLDTLKSSIGRLLVDENSGTIMIVDTQERVSEMEKSLAVLEQKGLVRIFDLKYAKAVDLEERLKSEFETNKLGTIKSDERTNQIIVKTFQDRMSEVETLIEALDRKTRQVLIDAKIVKVSLRNNLDAGIDWDAIFTNMDFHGIDKVGDFRTATDNTTPGSEVPAVTRVKLAPKLGLNKEAFDTGDLIFSTVNRDGYELFRYLRNLGETKIISKPRLLVTENQQAKIHVGTKEAYVTTTTTTGTSTATTAEEVQFIDVGIKFAVTPHITSDGFIEMSIAPEVSSVVRTLVTQSLNRIPIVDTSIAETKVVVKDGATVIIGGLRKNEEVKNNDEVPGVSRIPLIGKAAFTKQRQDDQVSELIIFITPHIVEGDKLVTGDEEKFGGQLKDYRTYEPQAGADA